MGADNGVARLKSVQTAEGRLKGLNGEFDSLRNEKDGIKNKSKELRKRWLEINARFKEIRAAKKELAPTIKTRKSGGANGKIRVKKRGSVDRRKSLDDANLVG